MTTKDKQARIWTEESMMFQNAPRRLSEATEENLKTRITRILQVIPTGYVMYGPNVANFFIAY
jgi:hypothetical protein